ncbi:MAG: tetratricopeptide repeat protein [Acetobacteraceae bacterium]|nr:tetratricopeptide repeat protein [Acetobacteraceae bacterium]
MPQPPEPPDSNAREVAARIAHGHALARLGEWAQAASRYYAALEMAPGSAEAHFHLANTRAQMGDISGAIDSLHDTLAFAPDHVAARTNLGHLLRATGQPAAALEEYRRAMYLAPRDPAARYHVATALADLDRLEEAVVWFTQAAEAGHLPAFAALGTVQMQLGQPGAALRWFRLARQAGDSAASVRLGEGLSLLTMGDLQAGWDGYEARPVPSPFLGGRDAALRWNGSQRIAGRTLLVWAEQGLGDSIMFVRYVPLLRQRGARVILTVQAPLLALMDGLANQVVPEGSTVTFDLHCPLPSLPRAFATELETIPARVPYLQVDINRLKRWQARLGPSPRVGLVWAGNPDHGGDRQRSLVRADIAPLLAIPGIAWNVLQKELSADDEVALSEVPDLRVPGPGFGDFADTAAAIAGLDLVVTVDTSVAHLAGALGRPCWIMLPHAADFRWLRDRDDSPWYPSVRLFRQARRGDWPGVVAAVADALRDFAAGR